MAAVFSPSIPVTGEVADDFATLYARFLRPLRRFFTSYRFGPEDVDDFTQEVFLRLALHGRSHELRNPEAFVFTLARNLVRDNARRLYTRALLSAVTLDEAEIPCAGLTPEQSVENQDRLLCAATALRALKPITVQVFVLHRVYGHSHAKIARRIGVSVSMVEKHVMTGIAALKRINS